MFSIIIMAISFIISIAIMLFNILLLIAKETGLWFTLLYILVTLIIAYILGLDGEEQIRDYLNLGLNTSNDYAYFGLLISLGISGFIFVFKVVDFSFRIFLKRL